MIFDDAELERAFERDNVAMVEDRFGGGYTYRPGELLAAEDDLSGELVERLEASGLRLEKESPVPGVVRFVTADSGDGPSIPDLVHELRGGGHDDHDHEHRHEGRVLVPRVAPNHVLFGNVHVFWGPGGKPSPAQESFGPTPQGEDLAGRGVTVAVLDTGIVEHDWFAGQINVDQDNEEKLDEDGDGQLELQAGHGTFIAGLIRQHAPGATVECRRVLSSNGHVDDISLAQAIWASRGADIINLSLGGPTHDDCGLFGVAAVLRRCREENPDLVVVASAGNAGGDRPFFPAALKGVIGVAALDANGTRAAFSNYGWWVDACAMGTEVLSTFPPAPDESLAALAAADGSTHREFDGWARWSGTSFVAPLVAAAIVAATTAGVKGTQAATGLLSAPGATWRPGLGTVVAPTPYA